MLLTTNVTHNVIGQGIDHSTMATVHESSLRHGHAPLGLDNMYAIMFSQSQYTVVRLAHHLCDYMPQVQACSREGKGGGLRDR